MTFRELEEGLPDTSFVNDGGRKRVRFVLDKLDHSWSGLTRTSTSVMCAVVAVAPEQERASAREMMTGLLGLMNRMSVAWSESAGSITVVAPDARELQIEATAVDKLGKALFDKVDRFGTVVMVQMLSSLPHDVWTPHFKSGSEARVTFQKEFDERDADYMTKALAETQVDLTKEFVAAALGAIDEDSKDLAAAVRWKGVATEVFEASMANGLGLHVAMETAIKTVGFPSAGGSNG